MTFSYKEEPQRPKYARVGSYIVTMDKIHGVMISKAESKEYPYQVFVTYLDSEKGQYSVVLEMASKEDATKACDKIAEQLGAL